MAKYILDGLLRWLQRSEWALELDALYDRHTRSAARELKLDYDDMLEVLGHHFATQIGGWVFEDLVTRRLEDGRNLADDYLKRRGWKETARGKAYIAALRDSTVSLYEVSGLVPGESFLARDLIRGGEPVRVLERSGSRSLRPWTRIATRILARRDGFEMSGGVLVFEHGAAEELLATLRRDVAADTTAQAWTRILADAAPVFAEAWLLDNVPRLSGSTRPKLVNDDGDELALSTTLYPLRPEVPRGDIVAALDRVEALTSGDAPETWSWIGESRRARASGGGAARRSPIHDDDKISLGSLELTDDSLWLSTNSPARMQRLRALVEPAVAQLVGPPFSEVKSIDEAMAEPRTESLEEDEEVSDDETRRRMREILDRHYASTLDDAIPFLGGMSPMAAVRTEEGRQQVAGWLKYLENQSAKAPPGAATYGYDFTWMWERLGIAHLRQ